MAGRQITDRSSPEEIAEAQRQLAEAQQRLRAWENQQINDPRRVSAGQTAAPEHVQILTNDPYRIPGSTVTSVGQPLSQIDQVVINEAYGVGYTGAERNQEMRRISAQYDYVTVGDLGSSSVGTGVLRITTTGNTFFVPGLGSNPRDVSPSAPSTSLTPSSDAAIPTPPDTPTIPTGAPSPDPLSQTFPTPNIEDRGSPINVPADTAQSVGGFTEDQAAIAQQSVTVPDTGFQGEGAIDQTQVPVTDADTSTDDSGAIDGTGVDAGVPTTNLDEDLVDTGESTTTDPDRIDAGNNTDTGSGSGTAGDPFNLGEIVFPVSPPVDIGTFAQPRRAGSGSSVESNKAGIKLKQNVLHNYVNWTYNIGLYMLTREQHAETVRRGSITESELTTLLIRSGGVGSKGVLGDKRDYYIENFRFTSIMGQNSSSRSSNNFDISFDIVEPYGVAFLAELVQLALLQKPPVEDHFDIPYLLEIKFRGYDSEGNPIPSIPGSGPKYIPIKIVGITFRITSSGTIYTVTAVPFAHSPLQNQNDAIIQENIGIEGRTFNELMESLFAHLNNTERSIAQQQSRREDRYSFVVHDPDLRDSAVGFEHITDGSVISVERQSMGAPGGALREYIQISAGSTLKSAIQAISGATDFGARFNTVGQPESEAGNENRPLRLLKIIPVVTQLREYNTSTKRYARDIVYRIETQRMYGFVLPDMPGASPTQRGWEKEYNWIFTGKNQDILDFEAQYNIQYYNIRTVFTEAHGRVAGTPGSPGGLLPDDGVTRVNADKIFSPAIVPSTSPQTASVQNSFRGAAHQLASDHMDNVLNNPGADMVVVDLTIIGDPDWIPQDRSILPKGASSSGDARLVGNGGSLATDVHDVFVMLKFKTPRDYNPEKGLMQIETDHTFVQGLYRAIKVENMFFDGKFEQKLHLVRVQDQISNDSNNLPDLTDSAPSNSAATETGALEREFGTFNPDGTVAGPGQAARPGNFRPNPQVTVDDNRPAVQQLADPDGDGNADDPEAQIFLDPSVTAPRPPNIIDTIEPGTSISDITGEVP